MTVERRGIELRQHEDAPDVGVQASADRHVDQAVLPADRHRRLRAGRGQGKETRALAAAEDDGKRVAGHAEASADQHERAIASAAVGVTVSGRRAAAQAVNSSNTSSSIDELQRERLDGELAQRGRRPRPVDDHEPDIRRARRTTGPASTSDCLRDASSARPSLSQISASTIGSRRMSAHAAAATRATDSRRSAACRGRSDRTACAR